MWLLRLLFTPVGLLIAGLLIALVGSGMAWEGRTAKPQERNELTQIEGVVQNVMMTWKEKYGSKRDIKFEVDVKTADGMTTQLVLKKEQITEEQASDIDGSQIKALVTGYKNRDVWEFVSEGKTVVSYETSRQKRIEELAFRAESGPYFAGGGVALLLVGMFRISRRRRDNVPTV